jgi:hypothetical protein
MVSSQDQGPELFRISAVLSPLLDASSQSIPAAIEANVVPGLVRVLKEVQRRRQSGDPLEDTLAALAKPIDCLKDLLQHDMAKAGTLWKTAVDAGIVPITIDLLTLDDEQTSIGLVLVSGFILMVLPRGEAQSWEGGLLRAVAKLLTSTSPMVLQVTADVVFNVAFMHPELIVDCRTWGIEDAVQRLTMHIDPGIAAPANRVNNLFFHVDRVPEVTSF